MLDQKFHTEFLLPTYKTQTSKHKFFTSKTILTKKIILQELTQKHAKYSTLQNLPNYPEIERKLLLNTQNGSTNYLLPIFNKN